MIVTLGGGEDREARVAQRALVVRACRIPERVSKHACVGVVAAFALADGGQHASPRERRDRALGLVSLGQMERRVARAAQPMHRVRVGLVPTDDGLRRVVVPLE